MNLAFASRIVVATGVFQALVVSGCTAVSSSEEAPTVDVDRATTAAAYSRGNRIITAHKPVYYANGTVTAHVTVTSQAGAATSGNGSCLLARYSDDPCTLEGVDDFVPNNGCGPTPAGWGSSRYCLTEQGSTTKHCYAKPSSAPGAYCIGSPGGQPALAAQSTAHSFPTYPAFPAVNPSPAKTTVAHWINYACIDQCGAANYDPGSRSAGLAVNEFDGDGKPDILAFFASTGKLRSYTGDGTGGLLQGGGQDVKSWTSTSKIVSPGDFNGDFRADVLELTSGGSLLLWAGNGDGTVAASSTLVGSLAGISQLFGVGDFNLDGFNDLMVTTTSSELWLYLGDGNGGIASQNRLSTSWPYNYHVPVGDFDADGKPDVMVRDAGGVLLFCKGSGTAGGFAGACTTTSTYGWNSRSVILGVPDFTGDGIPDLIARDTSFGDLYKYNCWGPFNIGAATWFNTGWPLELASVF
jgi:hypothetical protein